MLLHKWISAKWNVLKFSDRYTPSSRISFETSIERSQVQSSLALINTLVKGTKGFLFLLRAVTDVRFVLLFVLAADPRSKDDIQRGFFPLDRFLERRGKR